jgi:hypothetical protein
VVSDLEKVAVTRTAPEVADEMSDFVDQRIHDTSPGPQTQEDLPLVEVGDP